MFVLCVLLQFIIIYVVAICIKFAICAVVSDKRRTFVCMISDKIWE